MKNKKLILILIAAVFTIVCFSGCDIDTSFNSTSDKKSVSEENSKKDEYQFVNLPEEISLKVEWEENEDAVKSRVNSNHSSINTEYEPSKEKPWEFMEMLHSMIKSEIKLKLLQNSFLFIDVAFEEISKNGSSSYEYGEIEVVFTEEMKLRVLDFFDYSETEVEFWKDQLTEDYFIEYSNWLKGDADSLLSEIVGASLSLPALEYTADLNDADKDGYNHIISFTGFNKEFAEIFDEVDGCTSQVYYNDFEIITIKWSEDKQRVMIISEVDNTSEQYQRKDVYRYVAQEEVFEITGYYNSESAGEGIDEVIIRNMKTENKRQEEVPEINIRQQMFRAYAHTGTNDDWDSSFYELKSRFEYIFESIMMTNDSGGLSKTFFCNESAPVIQAFDMNLEITDYEDGTYAKGDVTKNELYSYLGEKDFEDFNSDLMNLLNYE